MTLLDRLTRSAPAEAFSRPQSFSTFPFSMRAAATGQVVTVDTAVELIPVYSAVNLIASAIGSLPMNVYSNAEPRTEAQGSRQWRMLHDQPNEEFAADEFWQWVTACLLLWGNAFIYKERDRNGVVQHLWPISPSRVMVGRETAGEGSRRFFVLDNRPGRAYDVDILHIRGLGTDGLVGYSPVQLARQQLGNDMAQQEFLGTFLKNGLFSSAVFTHPNRLSKEAQDRLREQISGRSGWLRSGEAITLEEGADLKNLTMSLVDSEFVQMAKMSEHRVAQLFGLIPPHTWGATDQGKTMTYQNSEFGGLEFVKWTLRPWLVRLESAVRRDPAIFPAPGPTLYPEFLVDALLRSDTAARWSAYSVGFGKWINAEWIQQEENITLPEGTEIVAPVMAAADAPADDTAGKPDPEGADGDQGRALNGLTMPAVTVSLEQDLEPFRDMVVGGVREVVREEGAVNRAHIEALEHRHALSEKRSADRERTYVESLVRASQAPPPPVVQVNVEPTPVTIENTFAPPAIPVQLSMLDEPCAPQTVTFERNPNGSIKSAHIEEES